MDELKTEDENPIKAEADKSNYKSKGQKLRRTITTQTLRQKISKEHNDMKFVKASG